MNDFDENNFTFEIEDVSFQMIHGKLSTVRDGPSSGTYEIEFDDEDDDDVYLLAQAYAKIARSDAAELQQLFDLQWQADMRAVKRWREAHPGNDLVLPDRANMVVWLMEQHAVLAATPAVGGERNAAIEECAKLIESGAGMADLIDQEELDQQAKYIRGLASALPSEQPAIHQGNRHGRQG